jgi:hypothetical protein
VCVFITAGPSTKLLLFAWGGTMEDMCVFITAGPSTKMFTWGGGGYGRTCATRDDEPRPVCVYYCRTEYKDVYMGGGGIWEDMCYERRRAEACVGFITAGPITKLCAWGEEESGGHVDCVEHALRSGVETRGKNENRPNALAPVIHRQ